MSRKRSEQTERLRALRGTMKLERGLEQQCRTAGRASEAQWHEGMWMGMGNAVRMLCEDWMPASNGTGCPDCGAGLANDGSCCDACGWVREETTP